MVIGIIGESCAGKSTLARQIQAAIGAETMTGRDYLRLAKSEGDAAALFQQKLLDAVDGENIIYIISEREHLAFLPEGAVRILVTAGLDTIKERFRARMHGTLPAPVAQMLERKHGMFDQGDYQFRFDSETGDAAALCDSLRALHG